MSYLKRFISYFNEVWNLRSLVFNLAKKDFKNKYTGSYLGILWAFIQPTIQILIFWFVFQVGFKSTPIENVPFILWLATAMVPWFFLSEAISNSTNSVIDNSFLVKKIVFKVSILPIIKIISSLFVHFFFVIFLACMFMIYGYFPSIYYLQILYYLIASLAILLGISWITSSLVIFFKDISQIIVMSLQFIFWLTPIFYPLQNVPQKFHFLYQLNPIYYITEGYRNTFIYKKWFWESAGQTIYFWMVTLILIYFGSLLFKKLRPHFADVI